MENQDNISPLAEARLNHIAEIVEEVCTPLLPYDLDSDDVWEMNFSNKIDVPIINSSTNPLPTYATEGSSGADVYSNIDVMIKSGESVLIPTGLKMAIPFGYECQVRPRSGLALKHRITVLNSPGTIDHGFSGEIGVILINHGTESFYVNKGDRIAQLVLAPVYQFKFEIVEELPSTERGEGGFGSTGVQ